MAASKRFNRAFAVKRLTEIYDNHVILSAAVGIDNLNQRAFWSIRADQIAIVERKALADTYEFTKYKLKLISKGRGQVPREISIPTIRDRIALRALCDFLGDLFRGVVDFQIPQEIIKKVKSELASGSYDSFIKLDVANFFPSVKHEELARRIRRRTRDPRVVGLVLRALRTPTVTKSATKATVMTLGIPQGLSISNVLAAAYLSNLDTRYAKDSTIAFHRFVDDILILCNHADVASIVKDITSRYRRLGLQIHKPGVESEKSKVGSIGESFGYLGYLFDGTRVSVREASVERLRESLVSIFSAYKHSKTKSVDFLLWRLNLRITGCIFQRKAKGWLFFFSEIDDEALLHQLDHFVDRLVDRFGAPIVPKKFVRSYFQIRHRRHESSYIPNFDKFDLEDMKGVLRDYFNMKVGSLADEEIRYEFRKRIDRQVRDLLTDVQNFGY